ncbi:hypothetical protein BOX15_Mlig015373g1 [Macrostomum lignano]|uniref:Profilin n=1 Tax=Macrostomum lignano TaxID=282301 RepID=A0A267GM59_9PLAT|nr:hypothetical protein BOX15_Mlig015373g1 [Macrostomum lignano]
MSWDSILHSMLQSDCINRAALAGRDGLIWSATPDFQPTQQEILNLVNYCEGESASPASFTLAGRRYLTLRRLEGCIDANFTGFRQPLSSVTRLATHTRIHTQACPGSPGLITCWPIPASTLPPSTAWTAACGPSRPPAIPTPQRSPR